MEKSIHGTEEQLELYALGRLKGPDHIYLEEHLLACADCCERLDGTEAFARGMKDALEADPTAAYTAQKSAREWFAWMRRPAFGMSVAFALLALVAVLYSGGRSNLAPLATLQLTAMRGEMPSITPARELALTLVDAPSEGGPFRVEIVNATGGAVWSGAGQTTGQGLVVRAPGKFEAGDYFARVYGANGDLLREYGFHARK